MDIFYLFQSTPSVLCAYASPSPHTGVRKQLLAHMDIFYRNQSTCVCGVCVRVCVCACRKPYSRPLVHGVLVPRNHTHYKVQVQH